MSKKVVFEPQEALLAGASTLEQAVSSTLGPKGNTVIIEYDRKAMVTKDGVTVAFHIELPDPVENFGAMLVKQAASTTAKVAGDGTTTSTIIATALAKAAHAEVKAGRHAIDVKREIDSEVEKLIEHLNKISTKVTIDDILPIATIASNNDAEIGKLIHEAYEYVTLDGMIALEDSKTGKTHITLNEGYSFDRGFISPLFVTDVRKQECVLENPLILVTDKKLRSHQEVMPAMGIAMAEKRPLLIIADEVEVQALSAILYNVSRGLVQVCCVKSPSWGQNRGELLKDISAITSTTFMTDTEGSQLEHITKSHLGTAAKVIVNADSTVIIDGKRSPEVATRIATIEHQLTVESVDDYITTQLSTRLAGLKAKVAVIHVGGATESEVTERKHRVDDALRATRSAIAKGYVLGGGHTLWSLSLLTPCVPLQQALCQPLRYLAASVNVKYDDLVHEMGHSSRATVGLNAKTEKIEDLREAKIYDPALVLEQAIINAVSAAGMILLSNTVVYNIDRTPTYHPGSLDDLSA